MGARVLVRLSGVAAALLVTGCTLGRPDDPVVVTGAQVPALGSVLAGDVVAFSWVDDWHQVPVQVDERKQVDFGTVYNTGAMGFATTVYADPGTFTGADANANVDADDEIAFRAQDAGLEAPGDAPAPAGTVPGTGVKLSLSTTVGGKTKKAWIYLFKRSGGLSPGAGKQYVDYDFNLLSGDYRTTYKLQDGPNPEDSTITTPYYTGHFSDRWLHDQLKVTTEGATGVDILDRAKSQFAPGNCGRTENTFNDAEGAFIVNKSGPVRAIRSYIGANSGPLTQREHVFYERRQDIRTFLRVHAIPGVLDYFDYSPAASGMTYRNSSNTGGVTINGVPDTVAAGQLAWESVDGGQGGLSIVHTTSTDIAGFTSSSYYFDDSTPGGGAETQCTGDSAAFGNSGPWITQSIPNTDPRTSPFNRLLATRTLYLEKPGETDGAARSDSLARPIDVAVSSFP
ncbi:MAG TPA: hypothetical protein VFQ12_10905 [Thermoleophilaceae bacterium]|nr:hypothetical protein [Thermoleophilaceae bacterium]